MTDTTHHAAVAAGAQELLTQLAGDSAVLRPEQLSAIEAAVAGQRSLIVQRTGFGKSAIYFIATKLRREAGCGPTLVVSPLLALMRDQVAAAERMGIRSANINSTNIDDWHDIEARLAAGELDLLAISPERLNNPGFARRILPGLASGLGLLVIDEAHCISDWGHDFRPDYRRIRDAIANLAPNTPVIATTATANERVCADIAEQLGDDVNVQRGNLDRESLHLGVVALPTLAERLAWIAGTVAQLDGTGIIYCLTVVQTSQVAEFLHGQGIDAVAYSSATAPEERTALEQRFKDNDLKALVATSALGMGVDKPDVSFVVHLGAPPSPIAYYQQVGRAGRSVPIAHAWLLPGAEDQAIWDWFSSVGMPPEHLVQRTLEALSDTPTSIVALEAAVDLRRARLDTLLKILDVDGAVERTDGGWIRTGKPWAYDHDRINRIRDARDREADTMVAYTTTDGCLMRLLREALDDPPADNCGRCANCTNEDARSETAGGDETRGSHDSSVCLDPGLVHAAVTYLRGVDIVLEPRKQWPRGLDAPRGNIAAGSRAEPGRALSRIGDSGWWPALQHAIAVGAPTEELIDGIAATLKRWNWASRPTVITWIPSRTNNALLTAVASALGELGKVPVAELLTWTRDRQPQAATANGAHRVSNIWGALEPAPEAAGATVLVLDDFYDTGWTATLASHALRQAGATAVLPFALARQ
jgi:ATP-dependent DNA helicase RecQ